MFDSERNIYLQETEIKPNKNAILVLIFMFFGMVFCWMLNEIGLFRVGDSEMRIGSLIPLVYLIVVLSILQIRKDLLEKPSTKYLIYSVIMVFTLSINTLLTFHTTMMLLFPIFVAMLYRSTRFGILASASSVFCTVFTPILGYLLHVWDISLFEELILIGGNVDVTQYVAQRLTYDISALNIGKIVLYLVLPRLIMVGSCSLLMFYVIRLGAHHVENQILLDRINRRDTLTGLYNQNYFNQINKTESELPIGIIFFDVNDLKLANDTRGHEYGDLLLKRAAKSILNVCDEKTFGFRIGGDEFLILMEGANDEDVEKKLSQWSAAMDSINEENKTKYDGLVCNLAYGCVSGTLSELAQLLRKADHIMYENKANMKRAN